MKSKILKNVAIIAGIIAGIILIIFIGLYLFAFNKVLEAEYGTLSLNEKIGKFVESIQSLVNTELFKNVPACNVPEVKESVYSIMQRDYLIDGTPTARWVDVGGNEGVRTIVGKLYYNNLNLQDITLEKIDKEAKKNSCAGTLSYQELLNEDGEMGDDRKLVYTDYSCHIYYEIQKTLDNDKSQTVLLEKECKQGDSSVEENDD